MASAEQPSVQQPSPQSFKFEDFKENMYRLGDLEKFLVDELPEESKLPNKVFQIREKVKAVLEKINMIEDESERREDMYHLVNVLTPFKEIDFKAKNILLAPEKISRLYQVNITLSKMLEAKMLKALERKNSVQQNEVTTTDEPAKTLVKVEEVVFPDNLLECRWSSRYPPKPHGLTERIKFMERLMVKTTKEDGMFGAIAIIGIPGVGKTALCQVMLANGKVKKHYPFHLWVCLSKQKEEEVVDGSTSRKVEILKRMLICLGHDDDIVEAIINDKEGEGNIHKLIFAIRRQLKGKKYLVVLDDASESDLDFLGNLSDPSPKSPEGGNVYETMADVFPRDPGGMVIVTARLEKVAEKIVGEKNVHNLPLLKSKDDCWEIFKDTVESDGKKFPKEDLDLKELITSKCASVPLAAKMMGLIMHRQIKEREEKRKKKALDKQLKEAGEIS